MAASIVLAWLVHLYTTLGAAVAFATIIRIEQKNFQDAFWLMSLAGDRLEDIIDYANYVIVPCFFLWHSALLPPQDAWWIAALPLLASAYGFCQREAKTADHFFLGFPSYWNIVVFYLYVLQTPRWVNGFSIIALSTLVFFPIKYIYPSRSPRYRLLTNGLGVLWGISVLLIIYLLPIPPRYLVFASLVFPAYYAFLSLWLEFRRFAS